MINQRTNLPPFKSVESKSSKIYNYSYGIMLAFIAIFVVFILFALPFLVDSDKNILVISFPMFLMIVLIVLHVRKTMKHSATIIDDLGIHYINKFNNKVIKVILWNDFQEVEDFKGEITGVSSSSDADLLKYDVFSKMVSSGKYSHEAFFWFVLENNNVEVHKERFLGNHIFSMIYSNKLELAKSLLLGLAHFRPDLKVHPKAFSLYYINPDSFEVDYEKRREDLNSAAFVMALVVIVVIFVILFIFF